MAVSDVKEMKSLTQENARLKKLLAERDLEIEVITQRRFCALLGVSWSNLKYVPGLPMKNAPVLQAMHRLSGQYPRYGTRCIRVFLGREGIEFGKDRCGRLWVEHGLQVPK